MARRHARAVRTEHPADRSGTARPRPGKAATVFERFVAKEIPPTAKIEAIRAGVAARVVDDMVAYLGVAKNVVFGLLHTPESTAHRLIKDNRTLDSAASERVMRVADAMRMAEATFGGHDKATQWLKAANGALGGASPLSLLDTEPGAAEVRRLLLAIDYGGTF